MADGEDPFGIRTHGFWGPGADEKAMINVRRLDEVDVDALPIQKWDGKSL